MKSVVIDDGYLNLEAQLTPWLTGTRASTTVFVLDQFERLFRDTTREDRNRVLQFIGKRLVGNLDVPNRVIIVIREDDLGRLTEFDNYLHEPLSTAKRYYVPLFDRRAALAAMSSIRERTKLPWTDTMLGLTVDELSREGRVRPIDLQLTAASLEVSNILTVADYRRGGGAAAVLDGFIGRTINSLPAHLNETDWRRLLLLFVDERGRRKRLTYSEAVSRLRLPQQVIAPALEELEKAKLICRMGESLELTHDEIARHVENSTRTLRDKMRLAQIVVREGLDRKRLHPWIGWMKFGAARLAARYPELWNTEEATFVQRNRWLWRVLTVGPPLAAILLLCTSWLFWIGFVRQGGFLFDTSLYREPEILASWLGENKLFDVGEKLAVDDGKIILHFGNPSILMDRAISADTLCLLGKREACLEVSKALGLRGVESGAWQYAVSGFPRVAVPETEYAPASWVQDLSKDASAVCRSYYHMALANLIGISQDCNQPKAEDSQELLFQLLSPERLQEFLLIRFYPKVAASGFSCESLEYLLAKIALDSADPGSALEARLSGRFGDCDHTLATSSGYRLALAKAIGQYLARDDRPDWKDSRDKLRATLRGLQDPSQPLRHLRIIAGNALIEEYETRDVVEKTREWLQKNKPPQGKRPKP